LKKLSVFKDNKKEFLELSNEFLPKILKLLQPENSSLFNIILRLLINLSHDQEIRILMVKYGFIPKICELIQVKQNYTYIIQLLYQLSIDDRNKIAFSYTDIIPTIMKMILETKGDRVDVDLIALGINLACNVKCAEYMCEDQGIKFLMKRALKTHDPLLLKMIRNISMHEGPTKMLFLDYIDDIMLLLEKSLKEPDLLVELLGILSNFTIEEFDWAKLTDTYHLLELIASQLQEVCVNSKTLANAQEEAAKENSKELKSSSTSEYSLYEEKSNTMTENQLSEDDDVTLQFVVLLGTMSNDEGIAPKVIEMDIIPLLITLMICKEEDDEIILQIIYAIYQFLLHESTRTILLNQTHIVSYLIDLLYDRNVKIREMCDTCLDIIAETNEEWVIKIRQQRFQWHNSEWLRLMANTLGREEDTGDGMMNEDILEYNLEKVEKPKRSYFSRIKNDFLFNIIDNDISQIKSNRTLTEFEKEASNVFFTPILIQENFSGNYDNYVSKTLNHIFSIKNLPYEKALYNSELYKYFPKKEIMHTLKSNKKLILLDLDETLIHSEHELKDKDLNSFDTIIRFKDKDDPSESDEYYEMGIYVRNETQKFLSLLNNYFNIGIFTASEKEYADAIIRYLDPNQDIIKFCLYRNNCVNVNDLINVKDLRVIKDIDLKKVVLVDNNMYSFAPQLSNGILINSFYGDKNDVELWNVLGYLIQYIFPADDVRIINEKTFGFKRIMKQME